MGWYQRRVHGYVYGKRSADAEPTADAKAEPWFYGGYGYAWPHYGGYYYGKRSADSEPTADATAEPWWYGGYGYGYAWPHYGGYYYERGLLMLSPPLMPRPSPGGMADTDMPGHTMVCTTM